MPCRHRLARCDSHNRSDGAGTLPNPVDPLEGWQSGNATESDSAVPVLAAPVEGSSPSPPCQGIQAVSYNTNTSVKRTPARASIAGCRSTRRLDLASEPKYGPPDSPHTSWSDPRGWPSFICRQAAQFQMSLDKCGDLNLSGLANAGS